MLKPIRKNTKSNGVVRVFSVTGVLHSMALLLAYMLLEDVVRVPRAFPVPDVPALVPPDMLLEVVNIVYQVCCLYCVWHCF